ncbi:MAG: histidinol-phosphate transaminase [Sarcina sp.]
MKIRNEVEKVSKYIAGKPISDVKRELGLDKVTKMASNENPLGCSKQVQIEMSKILNQTFLYPDAGNHDLIQSLSKHLNVDKDEIVLGAGSSSIIKAICLTLLDKGDECIMPELTFPLYENYTNLMGGKSVKIPLKDMKLDIERMIRAISIKTKIIWFCNPNNPTGTFFTSEEFEGIMERIPQDVLVVMDEAYIEYVNSENKINSIELFKKYQNFMFIRTFSKAYGLAGLRVGYGVANNKLVGYLNRVITPFEINSYSGVAAMAALNDTTFIKQVNKFNKEQKEFLYKSFDKLGYEYVKSEANFILLKVNNDKNISKYLLENGFIIRSGYLLGCEGYIRISIGNEIENKEFIDILSNYEI